SDPPYVSPAANGPASRRKRAVSTPDRAVQHRNAHWPPTHPGTRRIAFSSLPEGHAAFSGEAGGERQGSGTPRIIEKVLARIVCGRPGQAVTTAARSGSSGTARCPGAVTAAGGCRIPST